MSLAAAQAGPAAQRNAPNGTSEKLAGKLRGLNNRLLLLHAQAQQVLPGEAGEIRGQAAQVIAERAAALRALIQQDPRAALTFAFSPDLLARLAARFPASASLLESHITVRGPVEVWVTDYAKPAHSKTALLMKVGSQEIELHFTGPEPILKPGELLEATGVVVGSQMAVLKATRVPHRGAMTLPSKPASNGLLGQMNPAREWHWPVLALLLCGLLFAVFPLSVAIRAARLPAPASLKKWAVCVAVFALLVFSPLSGSAQTAACSTTGIQNVVVLLVTFPGDTPPAWLTSQYAYQMFFGTTDPSLKEYWSQASYGQTPPAGDVFGWYTLGGAYSCANITQFVADSVNAAIASGVKVQAYDRIFVIFPDMSPSCGWAGFSSVGCYSLSATSGTLPVSSSVLVWSYLSQPNQAVGIVAHEAGHQLGLTHARLREFGTEPLGPLGTTGALYEYGDHFSAMGYTNLGEYAAGHKADVLNWLHSGTNYLVVQSSGTYTIEPYETNPDGLVALKIQRGTGNNAWLWVEYRQPIGYYDSTLPTQPFSGALIHYEDSITLPQTDLLDFTAPSTYNDDPALAAGQSWQDPYTNLSISVLSATSTGLTVSVNYGATPCTPSAPSVSLSPADPSIYAGQSASYTVSVTDHDSSGCSSNTFNLSSSGPSGWPRSLSVSSITLSPGQSGSATLTEGAPSGTAPGTYAVGVIAADSSSTGSGTANATVMAPPPLAVSIAVSGTTFTPPTTVPITATVTYNGAPASGASVTFTLAPPTGGATTKSATTNSSGIATWSYKLSSKSPAGTYSVSAQAALTSGTNKTRTTTQTATSNTVTFSVQ